MRKAITVCLWLGLGVCIVLLFSQAGQKSLLNQEKENARRKNEVLQTLYDQAKKEWQKETADLKEENSALKARISSLNEEMNAARQAAQASADALTAAQAEWDAQRLALTAEKDAASGRLSEVLAFLLTPAPEALELAEPSPTPEDETDVFAADTPAPEALPTLRLPWLNQLFPEK